MFESVRSKFTPYFKTQLGELYNADCMELMKAIPDKTIGLIVTDPPWLTTNLDFDKADLDFRAVFVEFKRILKDNGWFFLVGTVEMAHEALKAGFKRKFEYIWVKPNFVPAFGAVKPASKHEIQFREGFSKNLKIIYQGILLQIQFVVHKRQYQIKYNILRERYLRNLIHPSKEHT